MSPADSDRSGVILVVPCYNEAQRWVQSYWEELAADPGLSLIFVDDGSTDQTLHHLHEFADGSGQKVISLTRNHGKAEAIRTGLLAAGLEDALGVGYLDADGAFPVRDVLSQVRLFEAESRRREDGWALWSSRVLLAGRDIQRRTSRHYVGRVILTLLAERFRFVVYDTQSGLKIFGDPVTLRECLQEPFVTKWFVDVELLLRWRQATGTELDIWEEPVSAWKDMPGSKLWPGQFAVVGSDLWKLARHYKRPA